MKKIFKILFIIISFVIIGESSVKVSAQVDTNMNDTTTYNTTNDTTDNTMDNTTTDNNDTTDIITTTDNDDILEETDEDNDFIENIIYSIGGIILGSVITFMFVHKDNHI